MGLNNFILNCEKENKELIKDIEYYKNKTKRLEQQLKQREDVIDECKKHVSSLSSKGRDCMIYVDVKKDILSILNESR